MTDEIRDNESTYKWYDDDDAGDCPHFWFQDDAQGLVLENLHQQSTVEIKKNADKTGGCNETSILTTVKIPESKYDYDVVLTGDSYDGIILDTLELKFEKDKPCKTVGVFQVPHHGSKYNSTMAPKKKNFYRRSCFAFYMQFNADIYLISHGNGYDHPHSEVITSILAAAVEKKHHCKIVVTATRFDGTKIIEDDTVSNWRYYVDIYNFPPYVTLDPNDVKLPEGLKLYNKKVHTLFQSKEIYISILL